MMKDILTVACQAAQLAGAFLRTHSKEVEGVVRKADRSFATELDRRAEMLIRKEIHSAFPTHAILGEEEGQDRTADDYLWVVDPLDGTHNMMKGIPLVAVSVAVLHRGTFLAGAICLPLSDDLYWAEKGQGAFKNGQPIRVSDKSEFGQCALAFDSGFRNFEKDQFDVLQKLAPKAFNTRVFGCSVGNLALLAEGSVDVIVEFDDYPWDYTAGIVLVREAGGIVTGVDGGDFVFEQRQYVASNGQVHQEVMDLIVDG